MLVPMSHSLLFPVGAMAVFFAYFSFCRVHGTQQSTLATVLKTETWSLDGLLAEASRTQQNGAED